jgi:hypothetical protein
MGDRCENCERVAAELRAEVDQLRKEFARRIEVILDKTEELLADIETKNLGLLADLDRCFRRLCDTLSERLQNPSRRMDEGPPKLN